MPDMLYVRFLLEIKVLKNGKKMKDAASIQEILSLLCSVFREMKNDYLLNYQLHSLYVFILTELQ